MAENKYQMSQKLGAALLSKGWKLVLAESCTGGQLAETITDVPGSSQWFDRGFVSYSNQSKVEMLGVKPSVLDEYGAVSKETAYEMAMGAINHSDADITLSITGIAGPSGGTKNKPVGTVWFGLGVRNGHCECRKMHFSSGRQSIRHEAVMFALAWALEFVSK